MLLPPAFCCAGLNILEYKAILHKAIKLLLLSAPMLAEVQNHVKFHDNEGSLTLALNKGTEKIHQDDVQALPLRR